MEILIRDEGEQERVSSLNHGLQDNDEMTVMHGLSVEFAAVFSWYYDHGNLTLKTLKKCLDHAERLLLVAGKLVYMLRHAIAERQR